MYLAHRLNASFESSVQRATGFREVSPPYEPSFSVGARPASSVSNRTGRR